MKIRNYETKRLEHVKIIECPDCNRITVRIDGEELTAAELLLEGWEFVQIEIEEMPMFNAFMDDARFVISESWDYFMGKVDGWNENDEDDKDDEPEYHEPEK